MNYLIFVQQVLLKCLTYVVQFIKQTAAYGHFGRTDVDLPWEQTDKADALKEQAGK